MIYNRQYWKHSEYNECSFGYNRYYWKHPQYIKSNFGYELVAKFNVELPRQVNISILLHLPVGHKFLGKNTYSLYCLFIMFTVFVIQSLTHKIKTYLCANCHPLKIQISSRNGQIYFCSFSSLGKSVSHRRLWSMSRCSVGQRTKDLVLPVATV